jgi:hypothetical protein
MIAGTRYRIVLASLLTAFLAGSQAQQPPLPAAPTPVAPGGGAQTPPILGQTLPAPGPTTLPPLPPAYLDQPAPLATPLPPPSADPGRDGWADLGAPSKPPGLFLNAELDFVWPSVRNNLSATVTFPSGATDTLHVPQKSLDFTVSPRLEVGYHLPDSLGDLLFGYQFLVTEGRGNETASFGAASIKSRLDINQFDVDYATATYSPLPRYDLKFRIGARMAAIFLDSEVSNAENFQQASNYFVGAGPSGTIDFERRFQELPELGIFLRADGAALTGQVRQKFRATIDSGTPSEEAAFFDAQKTQVSEVLTLQAGFVYHPFGISNDRLRIVGGYEFQHWWGVGKLNGSVAPANVQSDAEITVQGIFLRGEYDF